MSDIKLTEHMVEYLRSTWLYHHSGCPANNKPAPIDLALMGTTSEKSYTCTCGAEDVRKLVGKSNVMK